MNRHNIDWTSPQAKREYMRLDYLSKVKKLKDPPAWHDEAYRDFRTGKYTVKELGEKYKITLSRMAQVIGQKMKR
jgi:hypothetical protein